MCPARYPDLQTARRKQLLCAHFRVEKIVADLMSDQRFVVEASQSGERLDKFVIAVVPGLGRKGARRLFEEGRVRTKAIK
jgi:hypothetical protein